MPKGISAGAKLPVVVFIHGGGFEIGSNSWPQYDFRRIVELSVARRQPVIGVNIKYGHPRFKEILTNGYLQLSPRGIRVLDIQGVGFPRL